MAELNSVTPAMKRRRIIVSAGAPVPIYSNKVNMCLQLKPMDSALAEYEDADDVTDDILWFQPLSRSPVITISDSDEDETEKYHEKKKETVTGCSLSPPPLAESPMKKLSRKAKKKINEVDRKLQALTSLLSPSPETQGRNLRGHWSEPSEDEDPRKGDVNILSSSGTLSVREIPLKVRCRMEIHKVPVLSLAPLSEVVTQLSIKLKTPPSSLLLMKQEVELQTHLSVECVVMAEDEHRASDDVITIRLQSKSKNTSQDFSLHRETPLSSVFNRYLSERPKLSKRKVSFQFDGCKVTHSQTPAQLDMEDGDIIEVWI
ncbi:NFATC2-interacting protein-like isoform X2 [Thalassophryne amazonica]|uniref:NFATC2-interacting protein-like isoform X2 n=1 Tax=Thalassophryne amazonica TaxID=390379 RepID=UPI0014710E57|nr:NFATC2-interacting protein-like isoform X2 [Thalassophryne amazonica]